MFCPVFTGLYTKKFYNLLTIFLVLDLWVECLIFEIWGNDCEYFHVSRIHFFFFFRMESIIQLRALWLLSHHCSLTKCACTLACECIMPVYFLMILLVPLWGRWMVLPQFKVTVFLTLSLVTDRGGSCFLDFLVSFVMTWALPTVAAFPAMQALRPWPWS